MPLPLLAPLIGAGASLIGSGINALSQSSTNKSQERFSREMYERQRSDALADSAFQNKYNSPAEQMARMKAAGLNTNLIYGQGSQAAGQAAAVRSSSPPGYNPQAPKFDASGVQVALMQMYDLQKTQAETNKIDAMTRLLKEQEGFPTAQKSLTNANTDNAKFQLSKGQQILPLSLEAMQSQIAKTNADTAFTMDSNERAAALNAQTIRKGVQEIINLRSQNAKTTAEIDNVKQMTENLKTTNALQQFEQRLNEAGTTKGDALWFRMWMQFLKALSEPKGASMFQLPPAQFNR
ncbi:MAG: DNA pilot protein [Microviridae sp.]|nr:MAG: DNA pilot protein [Microviridae sp.]